MRRENVKASCEKFKRDDGNSDVTPPTEQQTLAEYECKFLVKNNTILFTLESAIYVQNNELITSFQIFNQLGRVLSYKRVNFSHYNRSQWLRTAWTTLVIVFLDINNSADFLFKKREMTRTDKGATYIKLANNPVHYIFWN